MESAPVFRTLFLLLLANGAPVIAKRLLGEKLAFPLDGGKSFFDGRPWFGHSKTVRGIVISVAATAGGAIMLGLPPMMGALFALSAMAGDLASSFIKRRMGMPPSSMAIGLDQLPESLLPVVIYWQALGLQPASGVAVLVLFFVGELILSRILYHLHVRDRPY